MLTQRPCRTDGAAGTSPQVRRGEGLRRRARGAAGGARAGGRGSPAPGAGHPEARADLPRRARPAETTRGGAARAPGRLCSQVGSCGVGTAERSRGPPTPAITPGAPRSRDPETHPRLWWSRAFPPRSPPLSLQPHLRRESRRWRSSERGVDVFTRYELGSFHLYLLRTAYASW